ncbi:MAG TPA: DUF3108 domain-containing protein [Methylotenera sp.]|nr:DUF3108 domain-containing protein [Methylotenera sp.]HPH05692.1 DUF3108 domain-containing protein [Methylotenera sp.]HPN01063.1 DUF3108 domain-containing protein [Methylotenera sp.]
MTRSYHIAFAALKNNKNITIAIIISLILHLLIASKFAFNSKTPNTVVKVLSIRLVNNTKPELNSASEIEKEILLHPHTTKTSNASKDRERSESAITTENQINKLAEEAVPKLDSASVKSLTQAAKIDTEEPNTEKPNLTLDTHESAEVVASKNYIAPIYRYIEAVYEVRNSNTSGSSRVMFNLDKNNTYTINEFTSWPNNAGSNLTTIQKSDGSITNVGLVSSRYSYQDNTENNSKNILFDWAENSVIFQDGDQQSSAELPVNTYDPLNYLYQFMFYDPNRENVFITAKIEGLQTSACQIVGEETLVTMIEDELKTIHLQCNENEKKLEIWLAKDIQNFPVKLLKVDKTGNIIQQLNLKTIATAKRE